MPQSKPQCQVPSVTTNRMLLLLLSANKHCNNVINFAQSIDLIQFAICVLRKQAKPKSLKIKWSCLLGKFCCLPFFVCFEWILLGFNSQPPRLQFHSSSVSLCSWILSWFLRILQECRNWWQQICPHEVCSSFKSLDADWVLKHYCVS